MRAIILFGRFVTELMVRQNGPIKIDVIYVKFCHLQNTEIGFSFFSSETFAFCYIFGKCTLINRFENNPWLRYILETYIRSFFVHYFFVFLFITIWKNMFT